MRRVLFFGLMVMMAASAGAQTDSLLKKTVLKDRKAPRSNDHLMFQLGYTRWHGLPDSVTTGGIPRSFNAYFLFDFPFKTQPKLSTGIGVGVGTDNVFFDKYAVDITSTASTLR